MRLRAAAAALVIGTAVAVAGIGPGAAEPACAAVGEGPHRVVVVIQTGDRGDAPVTRVCVRFDEESLTGAEVLRRADVDAVFKTYGGMGEFVCSILGVGPDVDDCPSTEQNWSYFRAPYPATGFRYSNAGVSSTRVYDGDVEGWRFANAPPPYASVVDVCGGPEPVARSGAGATTTTTTTTPAPVPGPATTPTTVAEVPVADAPPTTVGAPGAPGPTTTAGTPLVGAGDGVTSTTNASEPATTTTNRAEGSKDLAAAAPAVARRDEEGSSTSLPAVALFLGLLGGLAGWWWRARAR